MIDIKKIVDTHLKPRATGGTPTQVERARAAVDVQKATLELIRKGYTEAEALRLLYAEATGAPVRPPDAREVANAAVKERMAALRKQGLSEREAVDAYMKENGLR